jgi:hypothetical protein
VELNLRSSVRDCDVFNYGLGISLGNIPAAPSRLAAVKIGLLYSKKFPKPTRTKPEVAGPVMSTVPRTTRSRVRRFESNIELNVVKNIKAD